MIIPPVINVAIYQGTEPPQYKEKSLWRSGGWIYKSLEESCMFPTTESESKSFYHLLAEGSDFYQALYPKWQKKVKCSACRLDIYSTA